MDLLSMLTRMLDGQSLEISPNKWHSLCTPPVCRSTRPNDLTNNKQNYQTSHRTANSRGYPTLVYTPFPLPALLLTLLLKPIPLNRHTSFLIQAHKPSYSTSSLPSRGQSSSTPTLCQALATTPSFHNPSLCGFLILGFIIFYVNICDLLWFATVGRRFQIPSEIIHTDI